MLDAADEVAFLADGPDRRRRHPPRAARARPGVPPRRDPRGTEPTARSRRCDEHRPPARRRRPARVRRYAVHARPPPPAELVRRASALHVLAALAGLAAPRLLGDLVEAVEDGHDRRPRRPDHACCWRCSCSSQTVLTRYARYVLARARRAGARRAARGLRRATPWRCPSAPSSRPAPATCSPAPRRDVDQLGWSVRLAVPEWTIAVVTAMFTFAAALLVGWWVALPCLLGVPPLVIGLRWYLAPRQGRLPARERGVRRDQRDPDRDRRGRPHRRGARPRATSGSERIDADIARRPTPPSGTRCYLRTVFFPSMEVAYLLPTVATLLFGGWLHTAGPGRRSARSRRRRSTSRC